MFELRLMRICTLIAKTIHKNLNLKFEGKLRTRAWLKHCPKINFWTAMHKMKLKTMLVEQQHIFELNCLFFFSFNFVPILSCKDFIQYVSLYYKFYVLVFQHGPL